MEKRSKKEIRAAMKRLNRSLCGAARREVSERLFAAVERLPVFAAARTVAFFAALPDEPETDGALERWSRSKRVLLPRVEGERMSFVEYDPGAMRVGAFGILEPAADAAPCAPGEIDLVVVPGTAFTLSGARMGRGRGYYDRYLSAPEFRGAKVGVCYAHQIVAELPVEQHDVPLDCVVTPPGPMSPAEFAAAYRGAFGEGAPLPLVFRYAEQGDGAVPLRPGCFFGELAALRDRGGVCSFNATNIGCGGGRFYTGFAPLPARVPDFVSCRERYKQTPGAVTEYVRRLDVRPAARPWLRFERLDACPSFDGAEGVLFFAGADQLSGLVSWACYDNDADDAVAAPFGSGCGVMVAHVVRENRQAGRRCFLGLFDPSVRPHVGAGELGFAVPMSRFAEMCTTLPSSALSGTDGWSRVRERMEERR